MVAAYEADAVIVQSDHASTDAKETSRIKADYHVTPDPVQPAAEICRI
jgi:hypothetical protein